MIPLSPCQIRVLLCTLLWSLSSKTSKNQYSGRYDAAMKFRCAIFTASGCTYFGSSAQGSSNHALLVQVGRHVPYRNDVKCREKWLNVLTPFIQRAEFNEEEDKALEAGMRSCFVWYIPVLLCHTEVNNYLSAIQEHGVGNWAAIRKSLPARTSEQCARRWQKLHASTLSGNTGSLCAYFLSY